MNTQTIQRVDEKCTRKAVEEKMEKYRMYLLTVPVDKLPSITASYSLIPSQSNQFNSKTENIAVERAELELEREKFINWVHCAVSSLKIDERQIIIRRYLQQEIDTDREIWMDLCIGSTKYYKKKWEAILRLAFNLKIEVYQKQREVK
ncbi:MAG: ArpU family phage packaging/lysis transcriptional regulator [Lysinibacillus sp.]